MIPASLYDLAEARISKMSLPGKTATDKALRRRPAIASSVNRDTPASSDHCFLSQAGKFAAALFSTGSDVTTAACDCKKVRVPPVV